MTVTALILRFPKPLIRLFSTAVLAGVLSAAKPAETDWLQWGGPQRNFQAPVARLAKSWPSGGPKKLWSRPLGEGYTTVLAESGTVYTAFRRGEQEIVVALLAATGKTLWERAVEAPDRPDKRRPGVGVGPYSTPLIVGARLFFTASNGVLYALDKRSGRVLWEQDLWRKYEGNVVDPGYSSSPLAWKETVIVPAGGQGRGLICFRQQDGSVVWKKLDFENTHASPILINVDGQPQVVHFMQKDLIGADPDTGDLLWSYPHQTLFNAHASTPVWGSDNILFISTAYNGGSRALRLARTGGKTEVKELWRSQRMRIHHTNAIRLGDYVYASNGDFGPAPLTCINVTTGQIEWQERRFGKANLVSSGDNVIVLDESGKLILGVLSPKGAQVLAETEALTSTAWTAPTLAGNILYVRDRKEIAAFHLGE